MQYIFAGFHAVLPDFVDAAGKFAAVVSRASCAVFLHFLHALHARFFCIPRAYGRTSQ